MSNPGSRLLPLLSEYDLRVACAKCCHQERQVTYTLKSVKHTCAEDLLFCRTKGGSCWRPVSQRPTFPNPATYELCHFFVEGSGCQQHRNRCSFASSTEEAAVWTFEKRHRLDRRLLCRLLTQHAADRNGCALARSHEEVTVCNHMGDKVTMSEFIQVVTESVSETAEEAAERIRRQFSGKFLEVCKACFQGYPQALTTKKWSPTCSAEAAHPWDPVLVHHVSENARKHIYSRLRPLPQNCSFIVCSHVVQGKPCWHPAGQCQDAKSAVELDVWKAEHGGLNVRPHLLSKQKQTEPSQNLVYCKVCLLVFPSLESYHEHCSSLEHAQLVSEDTRTKCRGRKPPHNLRDQLLLCDR